jgi:hypothetical protein
MPNRSRSSVRAVARNPCPTTSSFGRAHRPKRCVDGVVAHRALVVPLATEHVTLRAGQFMQIAKQRDGLPGQRHDVGVAIELLALDALHPGWRHRPHRGVEVELARGPHDRRAGTGAQQLPQEPQARGIDDGRERGVSNWGYRPGASR